MIPSDYRGLIGCQLRPLTKGEMKTFLLLAMAENDPPDSPGMQALRAKLETTFGFGVLSKRLAAAQLAVSFPLQVFLVSLCENPAQAVLWAFTLAHMAREVSYREIRFDDFAMGHFALGAPVETEYARLWQLQKMSREERGDSIMDNWLDSFSVWPLQHKDAPT